MKDLTLHFMRNIIMKDLTLHFMEEGTQDY
jgi:hypothetical protein